MYVAPDPGTVASLTSGRVGYVDGSGQAVGEERFELLRHAGGGTLRAVCELSDAALLRDVNIAFDTDLRPLDGWCRLTRHGDVIARQSFAFGEGGAEVQSELPGREREVQTFEAHPELRYLGLHPLQGDAMIVSQVGVVSPGDFVTVHGITNSISENGDESLGAKRVAIEVGYHGTEELEVGAGVFTAARYTLRWSPGWPPATLWVRSQDLLFLKLTWEQVENRYELVEYHERP